MKSYTGIVTSNKMNKTLIVAVAHQWNHPIYKKLVKRVKKYAVHNEKQVATIGDHVTFTECRPLSKTVHFTLVKVIKTDH